MNYLLFRWRELQQFLILKGKGVASKKMTASNCSYIHISVSYHSIEV